MFRLVVVVAVVITPGLALAHPDHVTGDGHGASHFLTDPFHVALLLLAAVSAYALRRVVFRGAAVR